MKLSISFIACLLASFFSRSGAQSSPVGRTNLSDCTIKCLQEKYYDYDLSDVCDQAKNVDFKSYSVCLAGKDNAFKQVCEASCDVVNAKTLLKRSHQNACRRVTTRYGSCMEGYLETWKRLSSFATTIKEESAKVNELVRDSTDNTQQLQSETSNAQVLLQEVIDQATEEQLESNVEIATVDWVSDRVSSLNTGLVPTLSIAIVQEESAEVEESVWGLDITQQQQPSIIVQAREQVEEMIDQVTEEQLQSNVEIGNLDSASSFETELVPTPGEEFPSEAKHSVELQGSMIVSEASIHHDQFTCKEVSLPFYTLVWRPQHISAVSNHDTTSQLQTRADMGEHVIEELNYGGEESAWNIASLSFKHIHAEVTNRIMLWSPPHELLASSDGGEGAVASIQATQAVDLFQLIDTGPSGRLSLSNSFTKELIWMSCKLCVEEPLWLDPSIDMLDVWERLPVKHKDINEHSRLSIDSRIELPPCELISAAGISCSFEPTLDMDKGSLGRTLFGKIDGSSYEVLRLHFSVSMLVYLFGTDNIIPSNIEPPLEFNVKETASLITIEVIAYIIDNPGPLVSAVNSLKKPICICITKRHGALRILEKDINLKLIVEAFFNQVNFFSTLLLQNHTEMNLSTILGEIIQAELGKRGRYLDLLPDSASVDNCVAVDVKVYTQNYLEMVITLIKQVLAVSFDAFTSLFGPLLQHHATKVMPFVLLLCVSISHIGWACGKDHASRGIATENSDSYSASATTDGAFMTRNVMSEEPQFPSSIELESFLTLSAADKDSSAKAAVMIIEVDAPLELSEANDMRKDFDGYSDSMHDDDHLNDSTAVQVHDALTGLDHPSFIANIRNLLSCGVLLLRESIFYEKLALMLSMLVYHNHTPDGCANEPDDVALSFESVTPMSADLEFEEVSNDEVISADGENEEDFVLPGDTYIIQPSRRDLMALRSELGSHWNSPSKRRVRRSSRIRSRPQYYQPT